MSIARRISPHSGVEIEDDRRTSWWLRASHLLPLLCSAALIAALTWPIISQTNNYFFDWPVHLWILRHQGYSVLHDGRPSLYVHGDAGVFYPFFAFYGGTLYAIGGVLVASLGGAGRHGYALCWVLAFVLAYGGWVWLGRMAGLGRWSAQAPPALFLTSPYIVALVYVRGDLPEFVAVCSMPLLVASGLSVLQSNRLRLWPGVALVGATVVFTGSHSLTLLWGGTLLAVLAVALYASSAQARRMVTRRGALRVAGLVLPAVLVNAWFLAPALAYQAQTVIAALAYAKWQSTVKLVFDPLFVWNPNDLPPYTFALPMLSMAWVAFVGAAAIRQAWPTIWMRLLGLLAILVAVLVAGMLTQGALVLALPKPYVMIQYTYRLENYILLAIAGGVLVSLVLVRGAARWLRAAAYVSLIVVVAISSVSALHRIGRAGDVPFPPSANAFWNAPSEGFFTDYVDGTSPEVAPAALPRVTIGPENVRHNRVNFGVNAPPGTLVDTNLTIMPALVHIDGAHFVGDHTTVKGDIIQRAAVLKLDDDATPGAAQITISAAHPWPVVVGQILSLLGVLGLAANVLLRRRRRSQQPLAPSG
jgi:hypothetical protein